MTSTTDARTTGIAKASDSLRQSFALACQAYALAPYEAAEVLKSLLATTEPSGPLPSEAPEKWADREGRKENPVIFIRRVYGQHLGHGLTRVQLRKLDGKLYRALSVWEYRYPEQRLIELPTIAEATDAKIAALAQFYTDDQIRKMGLTLQNRRSRSTRVAAAKL